MSFFSPSIVVYMHADHLYHFGEVLRRISTSLTGLPRNEVVEG